MYFLAILSHDMNEDLYSFQLLLLESSYFSCLILTESPTSSFSKVFATVSWYLLTFSLSAL